MQQNNNTTFQRALNNIQDRIDYNTSLRERWVSPSLNQAQIPCPDQKRTIKDLCCLIIFIIVSIAMISISIYALINGSIDKMLVPIDSDGKKCGVDLPGFPYLYYPSPHIQTMNKTVCIKQCPTTMGRSVQCSPNSVVKGCTRDLTDHFNLQNQFLVYQSSLYFHIVCLPRASVINQLIGTAINLGQLEFVEAVQNQWPVLIAAPLIAIVFNILFWFLMKLSTRKLMAFLMVNWYVALILTMVLCFMAKGDTTLLVIGIIASITMVFSIVYTVINYKYYEDIVNLVKESVKLSHRCVWMMFMHLGRSVLSLLYFAIWIFISIAILSLGNQEQQNKSGFIQISFSGVPKLLFLLHTLNYFWVNGILSQFVSYMIAGATTTYYFGDDTPFSQTLVRLVKFNLGSIVASSFLVGLFQWLTTIILSIIPRTPLSGYREKLLTAFLCCCGSCIDNFLSAINDNAYTMMNLFDFGFCQAGSQTSKLFWRNYQIAIYESCLVNLFSMVRIQMSLFTSGVCWLCLKYLSGQTKVKSRVGLLIIVFMLVYITGSFFIQTLSTISNSLIVSSQISGQSNKGAKEQKQVDLILRSVKDKISPLQQSK